MPATTAVQLVSVAEELKVWVLKLGADAAEDDWIAVDSRSLTGPADGRSARGDARMPAVGGWKGKEHGRRSLLHERSHHSALSLHT